MGTYRYDEAPGVAYRYGDTTYAFQFHPEVTPIGFTRWQDSKPSQWGQPAMQSREEQDAIRTAHDPAQAKWIDGFLENFMAGVA